MGREVKRIALNFSWPLNKIWKGYVNPYYHRCLDPDCRGGYTTAGKRLRELVGLILLSGEDSINGRCHPYFRTMDGLHTTCAETPGKDMAELTAGLAGRPPTEMLGHDACDQWRATAKIKEAAGVPEDWGTCKTCKGHDIDPDYFEKYENWEPTEPPSGEGWQMWETTSEGSPISPVFGTPEELARWLADTGASAFGNLTSTYDQWLKMIKDSWAPSAVSCGDKMCSGVEFVGKAKCENTRG